MTEHCAGRNSSAVRCIRSLRNSHCLKSGVSSLFPPRSWLGADGAGQPQLRRQCPSLELRERQCAMPHCERYYVRCRHKHCCSMCSVGQHTARCDDEWRRYQERQIRAQARAMITQCVVRACTRIAGVGHVHCCTLCCRSRGQEHTEQCQSRQQYVHVVGGMAMAG